MSKQYKKFIKDVVNGTIERNEIIVDEMSIHLNKDLNLKKLESIKELNGLSALDELLIPMDQAIIEMPQVFLEHDTAKQIKHGQFISLDKLPVSSLVRL